MCSSDISLILIDSSVKTHLLHTMYLCKDLASHTMMQEISSHILRWVILKA